MPDPSLGSRPRGPRSLLIAALAAGVAFVALAGGVDAGEPTLIGDVDCDGDVTSLDAVLILQYTAGLLDALPCPDNGDPSGDGLTNSLDAQLVLQHTAGLVDDFVTFALAVHRPEGVCDESSVPVKCDIPAGSEFGVSILVGSPPAEGYVGIQAFLYFGELQYNPAALVSEEVVWPDAGLNLRSMQGAGAVVYGLLSNALPPFGLSTYRGSIVELSMTCPSGAQTHTIALLSRGPGAVLSLGSYFQMPPPIQQIDPVVVGRRAFDLDLDGTVDTFEDDLAIAAELEVNCVEETAA